MVSLKRIAKIQHDKLGSNANADDGDFNKYICTVICNSKAWGALSLLYVFLGLSNILMGAIHMKDCDYKGTATLLIIHGSLSILINVKNAVENLCMKRNSSGELDHKPPEICHIFPYIFGLGWLGTGIGGFATTLGNYGRHVEECSSMVVVYYAIVVFALIPLTMIGYIIAVICTSYAAWLYRNNNNRYMSA